MMKENRGQFHTDGIAAMIAYAVLAAGIVVVLLAGIGVYRRVCARDMEAGNERICIQYLVTKVRSAESGRDVSVETLDGGVKSLCITENVGDRKFSTYIFCADGMLKEVFTAYGEKPDVKSGEKLVPMSNMDIFGENGILTIVITGEDGGESTVRLAVRGES